MALGVQFKIPKLLQDKTNGTTLVEVKGGNVLECIKDLIRRYPGLTGMILDEEGGVLLKWMVYINNKGTVPSNEASYPVKDGDTITLVPMIAGG